ncbi:MAG: hypothetical protein K8T25_16215 [Planctomycetia bacterium]|nr:hypothetical protein [Planctomycetia bacterium]
MSYASFPKLPKGPYSDSSLLVPVWFIGGPVLAMIVSQLPPTAAAVTAIILSVILVILVQTMFLQSACRVYNAFFGGAESERRVAVPGWIRAMKIVTTIIAANLVLGAIAFFAIPSTTASTSMSLGLLITVVISMIVVTLLSLLISATILARLLPTTFRRGLTVLILHVLFLGLFVTPIALLLRAMK